MRADRMHDRKDDERLLDMLDDNDDVQEVYSNADFDEAMLESIDV